MTWVPLEVALGRLERATTEIASYVRVIFDAVHVKKATNGLRMIKKCTGYHRKYGNLHKLDSEAYIICEYKI